MTVFKKIIISILLTGIGAAAFRLSFDAQVTLAAASGIDIGLAWMYPAVVDAAILTGMLLRVWVKDLPRQLAAYLWGAIAAWTVTSIVGNAIHIFALPSGRITVPNELAVVINTVPAVTLFLIIHLVATTAFRAAPEPTPEPVKVRRPAKTVRATPALEQRTDVPPVTDEELLAMADDEGLSMQQIADRIGRSKSYVGERVKRLRDEASRAEVSA